MKFLVDCLPKSKTECPFCHYSPFTEEHSCELSKKVCDLNDCVESCYLFAECSGLHSLGSLLNYLENLYTRDEEDSYINDRGL